MKTLNENQKYQSWWNMMPAKTQAGVDAIISHLSPAEIEDLQEFGTKSDTYAAMAALGDPFWADAVATKLHHQ